MGKSKSQKQKKNDKKVQQYMKKKGYKEKVIISQTTSRQTQQSRSNHTKSSSSHSQTAGASGGLSRLQQTFQKKLEGSRFRVINERLYTCPGSEAFSEFQKNPSLFKVVSPSIYPIEFLLL